MNIDDLNEYVNNAIKIAEKINATEEQLIEELEYIEGMSRGFNDYNPVFKFLTVYQSLIDACIGVDEFKDFTLLFNTVEFQYYNVVKKLLEMGANPNKVCEYNPLKRAIEDEWVEGVKLLLEYGADPELSDKSSITPMIIARKKGGKEIITLLEEAKHKK